MFYWPSHHGDCHLGSPGFAAFHNAKSAARFLPEAEAAEAVVVASLAPVLASAATAAACRLGCSLPYVCSCVNACVSKYTPSGVVYACPRATIPCATTLHQAPPFHRALVHKQGVCNLTKRNKKLTQGVKSTITTRCAFIKIREFLSSSSPLPSPFPSLPVCAHHWQHGSISHGSTAHGSTAAWHTAPETPTSINVTISCT